MKRSTRMAAVMMAVGGMAVGAWGQMSIEGPPPESATRPSAPVVAPSTAIESNSTTSPAAATTAPSAQSVLDNMLKDHGREGSTQESAPMPMSNAAPIDRSLTPAVTEVAPEARKGTRLREGEFVWARTGRLVKDEKSGAWYFDFEADGKNMKDPPMTLIPSKLLNAMEQGSDEGRAATRFKVSGEVTEYGGKNYLWVQHMEILREMNKGIGG